MPSSAIMRFSCICQHFTRSFHPTLRECGVNECGVRSGVWSGPKKRKKKKERKHLRVPETARNALLSSLRLAVPFGLLDLFNFSLMLGRSRAFTERKLCRSVGWCCATQTAADVLRGGDRYWESAQCASASLPLPACGCGSAIQTIKAARSRQTPAFVSNNIL